MTKYNPEFKTQQEKNLYLSPIVNMATGEILSFSPSHNPNLSFVMESLYQVLPIPKEANYRTPIHSGQG